MKITTEHKKVLAYLSLDTCNQYNYIEGETGISEKRLKKLMLELKIGGYAVYQKGILNCDGEAWGSGHFLTEKGEELQKVLGIEYLGYHASC